MIPDCTLVTASFDLTKYNNKGRGFDETLKKMEALLQVPCYLVIFTDEKLYPCIKELRDKNNLNSLTKYIISSIEEIETMKYVEIVRKNRELYHPTKDERTCPESHLLTCNKLNFVLEIILSNPFNTSKFGWIDSNIGENFSKICTNYQNNMLLHVLNNCSEKFHIQISNVCDKKYIKKEHLKEYYERYRWVVCGCLFLTGKEIGLKIIEDFKKIFITTTEMGYGHGEEMMFLEILDKYYDNIERSYGDYQHILNNFVNITTGIDYIYNYIAKTYLRYGYHRECYDVCSKVINQFDNYQIKCDYNLYFLFLFNCYVSSYYLDKIKAKELAQKINKLLQVNPYMNKEYNKNKEFYDSQFAFIL